MNVFSLEEVKDYFSTVSELGLGNISNVFFCTLEVLESYREREEWQISILSILRISELPWSIWIRRSLASIKEASRHTGSTYCSLLPKRIGLGQPLQ